MKAVMQKQGHSDERKKDSIIQSINHWKLPGRDNENITVRTSILYSYLIETI